MKNSNFNNDLKIVPWYVGEIFDTVDKKYKYWNALFQTKLVDHMPLKRMQFRSQNVPYRKESGKSSRYMYRYRDHLSKRQIMLERTTYYFQQTRILHVIQVGKCMIKCMQEYLKLNQDLERTDYFCFNKMPLMAFSRNA